MSVASETGSPVGHPYWSERSADVLASVSSTSEGLSSADAAARLAKDGPNSLRPPSRRAGLWLLAGQFRSPIILILVAATVVAMLLGDVLDGLIILAIIAASAALGAWQERSAGEAVEALLRRVQVHVEVLRDGAERSVGVEGIVAGDVVVLRAGDIVPADCRVVESHNLLLDESALTGEPYPVEKSEPAVAADAAPGARTGALFAGTHVVSGLGRAVAVHTGRRTELGTLAARLGGGEPKTAFEQGLTAFGLLIVRATLVLVAAIFVVNLFLGRAVIDSFLFSLALAVGLTPQMLPAIVTVSLAASARRMAAERVIVKRLEAIEDVGGMTVLCVDKTGTITAGVLQLDQALTVEGEESGEVLRLARLNAGLQQGFGNPLDDAILQGAGPIEGAQRLDEVPYDFKRKRISVLVRADERADPVMVTKGAFAGLLTSVTQARVNGGLTEIEEVRAEVEELFARLSKEGYRVLAIATRELPGRAAIDEADEKEMVLEGLLAFHDPAKPGAADAIGALARLGVSVRLVTGDNRLVAQTVAGAVGIATGNVLLGADLDGVGDAELVERVKGVSVFAEVEPLHKVRIVKALRDSGAVVGFMGDGINDAAALHAADVGISVDTAVDVAKQAAAVVLLDKSLNVVLDGVRLGRNTFANTLKYVRVTISANFGNMLSMAASVAFLPFLPLLPRQILLLNFLSDIPGVSIAGDSVDPEQIARPFAWDVPGIRNFMLVFGLVSSGFDILTFLTLRLTFDADPELFRSGWFIVSTLTELAAMLVLRTRRPFYRSMPGRGLLWGSLGVAAITVLLPFSPLAGALGFEAIPALVMASIAGLTASYVVANEVAKRSMR